MGASRWTPCQRRFFQGGRGPQPRLPTVMWQHLSRLPEVDVGCAANSTSSFHLCAALPCCFHASMPPTLCFCYHLNALSLQVLHLQPLTSQLHVSQLELTPSPSLCPSNIHPLILLRPCFIVYEDHGFYRGHGWRTERMIPFFLEPAGAESHTPK